MPGSDAQSVLPDELLNLIDGGTCVAFIGSGASGNCYDSWDKLIERLCKECQVAVDANGITNANELLKAADKAKKASITNYLRCIGKYFGRQPTETNVLYQALLDLKFKTYLTTNLDPLLAREGNRPRHRNGELTCFAYPDLDLLESREPAIHYLHGYVQQDTEPADGTIVLSRSEFKEAYSSNTNLMNFLVPILEKDPVCFIGCRLKEGPMHVAFHAYQRNQRKRLKLHPANYTPPAKYILLADIRHRGGADCPEDNERKAYKAEEESFYRNLGIQAVWYPVDAADTDFSVLRRIFDQLAQLSPIKPENPFLEASL